MIHTSEHIRRPARSPSRPRAAGRALAAALSLVFGACGGSSGTGGGGDVVDDSSYVPVTPALAWVWEAPEPAYAGMPAADDEGVAATHGGDGLVLLDLDGSVVWDVSHPDLRDVAPLLMPDSIVATTEDGVVAFDRGSGRVLWEAELGERANTPVLAAGRLVVSTWERSLVALDVDDGLVAWRASLPGRAIGPAATDGDTVVASWAEVAPGAGLVAVDASDGRQRWSVPLERTWFGGVGGPAVADAAGTPVVVLVSGDIAAHAFDLADGRERWRTETQGAGASEVPPLPLGDKVLVAHRLGGLALLDAATGQPRWTEDSDGVAIRGGPVAASPDGPFAFPLDDGRMLVAGPGEETGYMVRPGRLSGLAMAPGGVLVLGVREAAHNGLVALSVW